MLRIAVQSKGRLYDETMLLLEEAGIKLNRGKRILLLSAKGFPVEVLFLRDDDIPPPDNLHLSEWRVKDGIC